MDKCLIIHVGSPKTGTTSFQDFMRDHAVELENRGVYFPFDPKYFGTDYHDSQFVPPAHSELLLHWLDFARDYPFLGIDWPQAFQRFRDAPDLHTMVVSHESFFLLSSRFRPDAFADMTRGLSPRFLLVLRHPLDYIASHYKEAVFGVGAFDKPPRAHPSVNQYLQFGYRGIIERLAALAPVDVLSYDALARDGGLLASVLDAVNIPGDLMPSTQQAHSNVKSASLEAIVLTAYLNTFHKAPDLRTALLTVGTSSGRFAGEELFSSDLREGILESWEADKALLSERHGIDVEERERSPRTLDSFCLSEDQVFALKMRCAALSPEDRRIVHDALCLAQAGGMQ